MILPHRQAGRSQPLLCCWRAVIACCGFSHLFFQHCVKRFSVHQLIVFRVDWVRVYIVFEIRSIHFCFCLPSSFFFLFSLSLCICFLEESLSSLLRIKFGFQRLTVVPCFQSPLDLHPLRILAPAKAGILLGSSILDSGQLGRNDRQLKLTQSTGCYRTTVVTRLKVSYRALGLPVSFHIAVKTNACLPPETNLHFFIADDAKWGGGLEPSASLMKTSFRPVFT